MSGKNGLQSQHDRLIFFPPSFDSFPYQYIPLIEDLLMPMKFLDGCLMARPL
jgi:hypothetical protein